LCLGGWVYGYFCVESAPSAYPLAWGGADYVGELVMEEEKMILVILYLLFVLFLAGLMVQNKEGKSILGIWLWKKIKDVVFWVVFLVWTGTMVVGVLELKKEWFPRNCPACPTCQVCPACPNNSDILMENIKLQNKIDNFLIEHKREEKHFR